MGGLSEELIKEEVSICFAHALAAQSGINFECPRIDNDSIDIRLTFAGRREGWVLSSPSIDLQLKATSKPKFDKNGNLCFKLPIKNFKDLSAATQVPRLLVVIQLRHPSDFVKANNKLLLINGIGHWISLEGHNSPVTTGKTITIKIPSSNKLTTSTFQHMVNNVGLDRFIGEGL